MRRRRSFSDMGYSDRPPRFLPPSLSFPFASLLALLVGCGASETSSGRPGAEAPLGRPCTQMAALRGFGIDVDSAVGPKVESARLSVCWDGKCQTQALVLHPSTGPMITSGPTSSSPDAPVSATAGPPTGGKFAYAPVVDLPAKPVEVELELLSADGKTVARPRATVTPRMVEANGPGCGESGPTGNLHVGADGTLVQRTPQPR